jgi:hypothetical protein
MIVLRRQFASCVVSVSPRMLHFDAPSGCTGRVGNQATPLCVLDSLARASLRNAAMQGVDVNLGVPKTFLMGEEEGGGIAVSDSLLVDRLE